MDASETAFWSLLFPSRARERDPAFRSVLTDILHTGLRQCGAIGLVGSLLYVGLSVFGLSYEISWTYEAFQSTGLTHQIVVMGTLIVAALSVVSLVLAQMKCSLQAGRVFGFIVVVLTAAVATFEGALRGMFGTEYVIPMYLVIVAIVPFRPMQVLGIGGTVAAVVYLLGPSGLAWGESATLTTEMARHLAFIGGSSILITGTSVALYRRHRAFGLTQASLQKNRDLLRRVQSVAQVGGWEYDPETDQVHGTEELFRILDLSEDQTVDRNVSLSAYPPVARKKVASAINRCLEDGVPFDLEVPVAKENGRDRWVRVRAKARKRLDETIRLIGTLQDITERHEMEERLREQERLLRTITDNVNDGIYRFEPGRGLVYANEAFARMLGYDSVDEVLTLDASDLRAHSRDPSALLKVVEEESADTREVVFRRTDGSTFTGLLSGTVVRGVEGAIEYVDGFVADITTLKDRERDLQRERDRFETLFQNLPTPVVQGVLVDGGAKVQNINREFEEVFGYDAQAVEGESMYELIGPEGNPSEMSELIQRAFEEGMLYTEVQRSTPNGVRDFQLHFAARHREGQRTEGYAMFVDITERMEQERTLREREQKTGALYTATERLLRVSDKEEVADRLEELVSETFSYPLNSVRLPKDDTLIPERASASGPSSTSTLSNTDRTRVQMVRAYRSGETVVAEDLRDVDLPINRGDLRSAAFLPISGHGVVSIGSKEVGGVPSFDLRLLEILSTHASGVLDRLDREEDLRQSEQRFRGIFKNAALGIALLRTDGTIAESNAALQRMLGLPEEALQGRHFEQVTLPDESQTDTRLFDELVRGQRESYETEKQFVRDDGQVFWGNLTVSRHDGPGATELIGMIEDIDNRKRQKQKLKEAKEEAEEMSRLKSAFLSNMSHEIRTPLTSILGFAEAISETASAPDAQEMPIDEFADRITKSGTRLLEMLDSILDLSRLEAGSMNFSRGPIELTQEVDQMVDSFEDKAEEENVTLRAELPDEPVWIAADRGALRRIQRNLISNALKYTESGGEAWARVRDEGETAVFEVEDTGIGMDPGQVSGLFDPFKQASTGTDRTYEGSGLGLAIVDRLVERMDGSISVNTEKGGGTCFTVRLPAHTPDTSNAGAATE